MSDNLQKIVLFLSVAFFNIAIPIIVINSSQNWYEADNYCISHYGTHLVSIQSTQENLDASNECVCTYISRKPSTNKTINTRKQIIVGLALTSLST